MNTLEVIDYETLWGHVIAQLFVDANSIHGPAHWRRMEKFGLRLAEESGADTTIVRLFAVFHDACRWSDNFDPEHGRRGGKLACEMAGNHFNIHKDQLAILVEACTFHAEGDVSADPTIGACWDSDRLDLWRLGIEPEPEMLSTEVARQREIIEWAMTMYRR